ncbi:MAG: peptidylprolyl isomerase [Elsteraceae bacterium]
MMNSLSLFSPTARRARTLILSAALCATVAAAPARAQTIAEFLANPGNLDQVLAKVEGGEVKRRDVTALLSNLPPQMLEMSMVAVYPLLLERLVDNKLVAAAARNASLQNEPEVKQKVADAEERAIQELYLRRALDAQLTDAKLREKFDAFLKENPPQEEVRARHILVDSEAKARDVLADLRKGADFAAVAKAKSSDGSARDGGDLGFFTRGDMVPEFSDAAFALKAGEVTKEPVKSQFGFHIIKVEARRKQPLPTFESAREQLRGEMSQELMTDVIEGLRAKAKVERFTLEGQPLPGKTP